VDVIFKRFDTYRGAAKIACRCRNEGIDLILNCGCYETLAVFCAEGYMNNDIRKGLLQSLCVWATCTYGDAHALRAFALP